MSSKLHLLLAAIVLLRCVLALPTLLRSDWVGHEADFYTVARFILNHRQVPTEADYPPGSGVLLQATQPPLYYALVIPIVALFDGPQPVPPPPQPATICFGWDQVNPQPAPASDTAWYAGDWRSPLTTRLILRLLNVVMGAATVVAVFATTRRLLPGSGRAALLASALMAFEPNSLLDTTIIGNEALLLLIASIHLYAALRILTARQFHLRDWVLLAAMTVLAILTRLDGWALLLLTGVVFGLALRQPLWRQLSPRARQRLRFSVGILLACVVGIVVFNQVTTGSLFGRYSTLNEMLLASLQQLSVVSVLTVGSAMFQQTAVQSYLAPLSVIGHPHITAAFGWFSLLTVSVAVLGFARKGWRADRAALACSVVITILLVFIRNTAALNLTTSQSSTLIYAPLRYYLPALPAAAILLAVGLAAIPFTWALGGLLAASWVGIGIWGWAAQPAPGQPVLLNDSDTAVIAALDHAENVGTDYPQLAGYQVMIDQTNAWLNLRLVAGTAQPLPANYAAHLEFTAPDGRRVPCQFPLANGLYPTLLWRPGTQVQTETHIPNCLFSLPPGTQIDLRWVASGVESPPLSLGELGQPWPRSPACPPLLGIVDGSLLISQYTAPLTAHAGTLYLPAVNWYAQATARAFSRVYTLTSVNGGTKYVCTSQPRLDTLPFSRWRLGEMIYFDECPLRVPANAPPGAYRVWLGVKDAQGNWLPVTDANGLLLKDSQVEVATVEVVR